MNEKNNMELCSEYGHPLGWLGWITIGIAWILTVVFRINTYFLLLHGLAVLCLSLAALPCYWNRHKIELHVKWGWCYVLGLALVWIAIIGIVHISGLETGPGD